MNLKIVEPAAQYIILQRISAVCSKDKKKMACWEVGSDLKIVFQSKTVALSLFVLSCVVACFIHSVVSSNVTLCS